MTAAADGAFVAVDWGTSSLRLWHLSATGEVLAEIRSAEGMSAVPEGGFEAVLRQRIGELGLAPGGPAPRVALCGMVGARQGWREAPYVDVPAPLSAVAERAVAVPMAGVDARILPGLAQRDRTRPDVMRGEETQLLGLVLNDPALSGMVCMPGTHCKWVTLEGGAVRSFSTAITGELFAVLAGHSLLRHTIGEERPSGDPASAAFRAGLEAGLESPEQVISKLFSIRAEGLLFGTNGTEAADRLSGLLIGSEVGAAFRRHAAGGPVVLVASGRMAGLYQVALEAAGSAVRLVDADLAVRAGLLQAARQFWPNPVKEVSR